MKNNHHRGLTSLIISFGCGYFLLLVVLLGAGIPYLGILLALLFETPVSGYYVLVMRGELKTLICGGTGWTEIPSWSLHLLPELMWLGMCMNAIMTVYALVAVVPVGAAFALVSLAHIEIFLSVPVVIAAMVLILPGLFVFALMLPLAVACFAWSNDISQAFNFCEVSRLAAKRCRFAVFSAIIFISASVLNITLTALLPELMPMSEPTIEFVSMVVWSKLVARSFGAKMSGKDSAGCPVWMDIKDCKTPDLDNDDSVDGRSALSEEP
jgi:hypothetical protein